MTKLPWVMAVLCAFALGWMGGHLTTENYYRKWLEGFGVGEYYLDESHQVRFRLKK